LDRSIVQKNSGPERKKKMFYKKKRGTRTKKKTSSVGQSEGRLRKGSLGGGAEVAPGEPSNSGKITMQKKGRVKQKIGYCFWVGFGSMGIEPGFRQENVGGEEKRENISLQHKGHTERAD